MPGNAGNKWEYAPGWPGMPGRWTSSAKSGVGTAIRRSSRIWFTISHGILNEVYYPRVDQACTRDLGLIVTDGNGFFSEEKRHAQHQIKTLAPGVPAFALGNRCNQGRYRIDKRILSDPRRDVLLQRIRFTPLIGALSDYRIHALLAPHLGNQGAGNTAWVGDYKGVPMIFAQRGGTALALACSSPWVKRSVGFVGASDGWQQLSKLGELKPCYTRAENGNVALAGEIELAADDGSFLLALAFGHSPSEAAHQALASLRDGFDRAQQSYLEGWNEFQNSLLPLESADGEAGASFRVSAAVLRTHESKDLPGGIIASLSIPWGFSKGDGDLGGYHVTWARDLVETAGGLLAAGASGEALRVLRYLSVIQEADGHWPQNNWLDGTPYWSGVQMDEAAFPILLVDLALREGALKLPALNDAWAMVRRAAAFVVANGPVTQQDRWEEDPGYSPFTLAVEIAALLAAADLADRFGEKSVAIYLRETADLWNSSIERWTWASKTDLSREVSVEGYYVRIAPPEEADDAGIDAHGFVPIKNRAPGFSSAKAIEIVSPDALALVRFGLRAPDDPRILSTIKVIDALLRVELPEGPSWRRYNGDGYGEHADGKPFDGTGIGRPWPLLTGERAHYELAAGNVETSKSLLETFQSFANKGGLLPEQVWDGADIPERELLRGKATGSAMPLVWAHAEHVKLLRSLRDGKVFDMPPQTVQRYQKEKVVSPHASWRFNHKCRSIPRGKILRIELLAEASVRFSTDGWTTANDLSTRETGLGMHLVDLPTAALPADAEIRFTFYWPRSKKWEGVDFKISIETTKSGGEP